MSADVLFFAYGTLQRGFANQASLAAELARPLGRFESAVSHPLVVVREPACANPGCRLLHRMCALLPQAGEGVPVEGDLYRIEPTTLALLDGLEQAAPGRSVSTYVRGEVAVVPVDGPAEARHAVVYFAADPAPWHRLVERGLAEVVPRYGATIGAGVLKACCRRDPGHAGPHDVEDVLGRA